MRVQIGSGDKIWPGFVNCDLHQDADRNIDCTKPLPFEDGTVEQMHAIHYVEHIHRMDVQDMLKDWHRTLKNGGKLVLELPCMDKIAPMIVAKEQNLRLTMLGIFGDPRDRKPGMMHAWCYTEAELRDVLSDVGFENIEFMTPKFHMARRDMRVECIKP